MSTIFVWGAFVLLVLLILAFDLGAFSSKDARSISTRQALFRTFVYFLLSCAFTVFVYYAYENHWFNLGVYETASEADSEEIEHAAESWLTGFFPKAWVPVLFPPEPYLNLKFPFEPELKAKSGLGLPGNGRDAATMYFTGYLVEQSLSMDNIFVIALIISFFNVPAAYQHRVLFWGIMLALVLRGIMIAIGGQLFHYFDWITYVFGLLLVFTAWKMLGAGDEHLDPEKNWVLKLVRKFVRIHTGFDGEKFFTRIDGKLAATQLFLTVVVVATTDVVFAVDSIPAVFGITRDSFLVFTSNVFAILGLRSLYFALADLLEKFRYLKYSLVAILGFVGLKMLGHAYVEISPLVSLGAIAVMLGVGVAASWWIPPKHPAPGEVTADEQPT